MPRNDLMLFVFELELRLIRCSRCWSDVDSAGLRCGRMNVQVRRVEVRVRAFRRNGESAVV
jgi:hypothetical protein